MMVEGQRKRSRSRSRERDHGGDNPTTVPASEVGSRGGRRVEVLPPPKSQLGAVVRMADYTHSLGGERIQRNLLPATYGSLPVDFAVPGWKGKAPGPGVLPLGLPYAASLPVPEEKGALKGAVVVLAGDEFAAFTRADVGVLVERAGGVVADSLAGVGGEKATHVVFGGAYAEPVVFAAAEAGIPVVSEDWVLDSVRYGVPVSEHNYLVGFAPLEDMAFVVAELGGGADHFSVGKSTISRLIYTYGGILYDSINAAVPNLYYVVPAAVTFDQVASALEAGVGVVSESFVMASIQKGRPDNVALHTITQDSFYSTSLDAVPLASSGPSRDVLTARGRQDMYDIWYDLSSASKMSSGIGFVCLHPGCKAQVPGPKAFLRIHMMLHHFRGEWAPPGAEPFEPEVATFAVQGMAQTILSEGSQQYAAAAARMQQSSGSTMLTSGGVVTVWNELSRCHHPTCRLPAPPVQVLTCTQCEMSFHGVCLQLTAQLVQNLTKRYDWRCGECKACKVCNEMTNDESLLFCDWCDRAYHTFCLDPPLDKAPLGTWNCVDCRAAPSSPTKSRKKSRTSATRITSTSSSSSMSGSARKKSRMLSQTQKSILHSWLHAHINHPYPSEEEKEELAIQTGLNKTRISTWFANARSRKVPAILAKRQ